jgi:hypothetical protein
MLFMVTLDMELYIFMTLILEECVGGKLQTLHLLQCLCCVLHCMICRYIALLNVMFKRNFPNMFPAKVLSHLPIMGTQCEILDSHGGKMGCHHHPIALRPFQFGLGFPYN